MLKTFFSGLLLAGLLGTAQAASAASLPDFAQLAEKEGRAVVNIAVSGTRKVNDAFGDNDDAFELFRRFGLPLPRGGQMQERPVQGIGSGFIIDANGYILTNAHVIADADEITVKLTDKRTFKARVVGSDARTDVALLKVDASNLPKVSIGDPAKARVGEWVLAIGQPFGLDNTVTAGIISAKGRDLPNENFVPFIQTDVAINPGNSGGPLFNMAGEVIGINSQIFSRSGGYMGLSFAIPIDVAIKISDELKSTGKITRGRIGVGIQDMNEELARSFGLAKEGGALLIAIDKDGPADKADLRVGDIILKVNGQAVTRSADLSRMITALKPGSKAVLGIWRDKSAREAVVTVGAMEGADKGNPREYRGKQQGDAERFGLSLVELNARQLQQLGIKYGIGVRGVSGQAAKAGLQAGDVLTGVGGQDLQSVIQLRQALQALKPGEAAPLRVLRDGRPFFASIVAPEKKDD
ncbi:DegQ family serine endoprotease [Chitinilyticum aquatile]|uniref:DegQ family serine endoprotease n=1 Tax=Chitinilyticum aquatile TaxID=362520 RepID=UPI000420F447|nr:DegQ family serine endoprotease [Chitinilyticum aquatile]